MLIKRIERLYKRTYLDGLIWWHYGTLNPRRIQLVASDRTLYVDPHDFRARKRLIAGPIRGRFPRNQRFWREAARVFRPDTVLDVGLNYGECLFSVTYDETVRLLGFEANPALSEPLRKTWAEHPNRRQIEILFQLVTDGDRGVQDFYIDRRWSGRSTAGLRPDDHDPERFRKISVPRASLDQVLSARKLHPRKLLFKVDVEGLEYRVLEGMRETLADTPHAVGFVEFNPEFLRRSGEDVPAYWRFLQDSFALYAFDEQDRWCRVNGWSLDQLEDLCGKHFETDLVLATGEGDSAAEAILNLWTRRESSPPPRAPEKAARDTRGTGTIRGRGERPGQDRLIEQGRNGTSPGEAGDESWTSRTAHDRWMAAEHTPRLVSVIVPTYNRAGLLRAALDSVRNQTYRPIELLVVDDGSTDDTQELLRRWAGEHSKEEAFTVRLLKQSQQGAPAARNLGLIESRGEFIQFLDSDDVFHPHKVEALVRVLQDDSTADYAWSGWTYVAHPDMKAHVTESFGIPETTTSPVRVSGRRLARIPTKAVVGMFRRELCRSIGPWEESLIRHQDWEYMTRLVGLIGHAWHLKRRLYVIRTHDQGRIRDLKRSRRDALKARFAAARAAERNAGRGGADRYRHHAWRRRLASRYFSLMQYALKAGSLRRFMAASRGLRRTWPWRLTAGEPADRRNRERVGRELTTGREKLPAARSLPIRNRTQQETPP